MRHANIKLQVTDADGLAANVEPAIIVLVITRQEIESGRLASVIERLHVLTDSAANVNCYRESMVFQVEGFEEDPRELAEIPEVRAYFRALTAEWPHWLWFLHRQVGAIALLLSLLCEVRVLRDPTKTEHGTEFKSTLEMKNTLLDLLTRGMPLFQTYGVDAAEVDAMIASALDELGLGAA